MGGGQIMENSIIFFYEGFQCSTILTKLFQYQED